MPFPLFTTVSNVWHASVPIFSLQVYGVNSSILFEQYIKAAEGEIIGYVAKRYAPADVIAEGGCPILVAIATREAIYRTLVHRGLVTFPPPQEGRHPLYQQHLDDMKTLKAIADGGLDLVSNSLNRVGADLSAMELWHNNLGYMPTFREDGAEHSFIDENKLEDIESDRDMARRWPDL